MVFFVLFIIRDYLWSFSVIIIVVYLLLIIIVFLFTVSSILYNKMFCSLNNFSTGFLTPKLPYCDHLVFRNRASDRYKVETAAVQHKD